jgi:hypothetical protein
MSETIPNAALHTGRTNGSAPSDEFLPRGFEQKLREGDERARAFIRDHPVPAVLGALALGYVVARILRSD